MAGSSAELERSFTESLTGSIGTVPVTQSALIPQDASSLSIVRNIITMSIPLGLAALAQFSIGAVLIAVVGTMVGVEELGASGLSFGLINATAVSFAAGFCGALETLLSHSYGRNPNSKLYVLIFADMLLHGLGQNAVVANLTGEFCHIAVFGIYPAMMLELLRRYFACQYLNNPLSVNLVIGALAFPFIVWALIKLFGFYGAPLGWDLLMTGMPASLLIYLFHTGKHKQTWGGWDSSALHHWGSLLKLAVPSMAMMVSEFIALEVNAITAGYAPPEDLAVFSIVYQTSGFCWSLVSGVFISSAVLVGNAIGQGDNRMARRCAFLCVGVTVGYALINISVVFLLRHQIPRLFSSDPAVLEHFPKVLPFFLVYHFFDCVQSCMMGILRGCSLQKIGALAIAAVYSVVGVPLGITLFFTTGMGVAALWFGPAFGVTCVGFPVYCYMMFSYIKWDKLESKAQEVPVADVSEDELSVAGTRTPPLEDPSRHASPSDFNDSEGGPLAHWQSSTLTVAEGTDVDVDQNLSFASHSTFYIPHRNILTSMPFPAAGLSSPHTTAAAHVPAPTVDQRAEPPFELPPVESVPSSRALARAGVPAQDEVGEEAHGHHSRESSSDDGRGASVASVSHGTAEQRSQP